jgi:hypothetical protein
MIGARGPRLSARPPGECTGLGPPSLAAEWALRSRSSATRKPPVSKRWAARKRIHDASSGIETSEGGGGVVRNRGPGLRLRHHWLPGRTPARGREPRRRSFRSRPRLAVRLLRYEALVSRAHLSSAATLSRSSSFTRAGPFQLPWLKCRDMVWCDGTREGLPRGRRFMLARQTSESLTPAFP